jgi:hypothetical protein
METKGEYLEYLTRAPFPFNHREEKELTLEKQRILLDIRHYARDMNNSLADKEKRNVDVGIDDNGLRDSIISCLSNPIYSPLVAPSTVPRARDGPCASASFGSGCPHSFSTRFLLGRVQRCHLGPRRSGPRESPRRRVLSTFFWLRHNRAFSCSRVCRRVPLFSPSSKKWCRRGLTLWRILCVRGLCRVRDRRFCFGRVGPCLH